MVPAGGDLYKSTTAKSTTAKSTAPSVTSASPTFSQLQQSGYARPAPPPDYTSSAYGVPDAPHTAPVQQSPTRPSSTVPRPVSAAFPPAIIPPATMGGWQSGGNIISDTFGGIPDSTTAGDAYNQPPERRTSGYQPQFGFSGGNANYSQDTAGAQQNASAGAEWQGGAWGSNPWAQAAGWGPQGGGGISQPIDPKTGKPMKQPQGQPMSMTDYLGQQSFGYGGPGGYSPQPMGNFTPQSQPMGNFNHPPLQQPNTPQGPIFNQFTGQWEKTSAPSGYSPGSVSAGHVSGGGGGGGHVSAGNISAPNVAGFQRQALPTANPMADFSYAGTNAQGQFDQATQAAIAQGLQNPSAYNSDVVMGTFNRLNDVMTQKQNEEMASRGLYNSTPAVGRLGDARAYLSQTLLEDQARQYQQDRASAIAQAMGWSGQQFGQAAQGYGLNQATNAQNFGQQRDISGLGIQQNTAAAQHALGVGGLQVQAQTANAQNKLAASRANAEISQQNAGRALQAQIANQDASMRAAGFNAQQRQNAFENSMASAQFNAGQNQQQFTNQFQTTGFNNDLLQQQYQNELAGGQFGLQAQNQGFNQALAGYGANQGTNQQNFNQELAGYGANQSTNQQNFNQYQDLLNNLLGYNQQQWQNDYNHQNQMMQQFQMTG